MEGMEASDGERGLGQAEQEAAQAAEADGAGLFAARVAVMDALAEQVTLRAARGRAPLGDGAGLGALAGTGTGPGASGPG
jgi:hypothetical protein